MGDWFSSVFSNLFGFLVGWFKWLGNSIVDGVGGFLNQVISVIHDGLIYVVSAIADTINELGTWLASVFRDLLQGLIDVIKMLFTPVLKFFDGIIYFLAQAMTVIVLVLKVVLGLVGVVFSGIGGFFNTIFSFLSWSGSSVIYPSAYTDGFNMAFNAFSDMGGDIIAGVLAALVWLLAIWTIFKVVSARG